MRATRADDGSIRLTAVDWVIAEILGRVPELLESKDPKVRSRFEPRAYQDEDDEKQWRELVGPDLRRLFASRAEIVRGDLQGLEAEADGETFRFTIPAGHLSAWEAALVGASHALHGEFDFQPAELAAGPRGAGDPDRDFALFRVEVQSAVLHLLIRVVDPGFSQRSVELDAEPDDDPDHTDFG